MTYDAVFAVSVALLRGLELQAGFRRLRLRRGFLAFDLARGFVADVGAERALRAARQALAGPAKRGKSVRWI